MLTILMYAYVIHLECVLMVHTVTITVTYLKQLIVRVLTRNNRERDNIEYLILLSRKFLMIAITMVVSKATLIRMFTSALIIIAYSKSPLLELN